MIETPKQRQQGTMDTAEQHDSAMDARVVALVEQWWREHETPMLLSRLGAEDGGDIGRGAKVRAGGLNAYLRQGLGDKVRVLQPSSNPLLRGAIPASVKEEDIDVDASFEQCGERASPRFHPAFWAAFRKPLDERARRFVSENPPVRFEDSEGHCPAGFVEIPSEYIAHAADDDAAVLERIREWLKQQGISDEVYTKNGGEHRPTQRAGHLLDRILNALEPEERTRVSMSLDVVFKLRRLPP